MTTFLLIRHGETDAIGKVDGGMETGLASQRGRETAGGKLAERLARLPIRAVYTSPLERAIETAEPIARKHGLGRRWCTSWAKCTWANGRA